jgi:hypothetical protein
LSIPPQWFIQQPDSVEDVPPIPSAANGLPLSPPPPSSGADVGGDPPDNTKPTAAAASPEAIFHTVPPCRQRIYQSQSYIRYIEGLRLGRRNMCDWNRELSPAASLLLPAAVPAAADSVVAAPGAAAATHRLVELAAAAPLPWLERVSALQGENSDIDTLFALRDFMLQEALNVVKFA